MFYKFEDIDAIHLELTSHCNLNCPQCARTHQGATTPHLPLKHLPLATLHKVFSEMGPQTKYVHLCGNYGDIVAYPQALEAIDLIRSLSPAYIKVYTNASARPAEFWRSMGERLHGDQGQVVFSIDGLADTNSLYRVGSRWEKIMENAKAFIAAGGNAVWEWLPFEHNDHQIDQAVTLANELGFNSIILKKNPRFSPLNNGAHHTLKPSQVLVHKGIQQVEGMQPTLFPIRCKYQARKMIFIDFEGYLLPCCWHGNRFKGAGKFNDMHTIMERYGFDGFDVAKSSVQEILKHPWYVKDMEYTIKILATCRKHCTLGAKMSNKDNRIVYEFKSHIDREPWEDVKL